MLEIEKIDMENDAIRKKIACAKQLLDTADHKMSQLHQAELLLREAYAVLPGNEVVNHLLALSLVYQGRSLESLPFHKAAFEAVKTDSMVFYSFVNALIFNNKYADAKAAIVEWKQNNPNDKSWIGYEHKVDLILRCNKPKAMVHWPQTIGELKDPKTALRKYLFNSTTPQEYKFTSEDKILTLGSCFAQNVARILCAKGFNAKNITIGEVVNSTYANLNYIRRVVGEDVGDVGEVILERLGHDPLEDRPLFKEAKVVIMTLGVAPCFFDSKTNDFVMFRENEFAFRQLGRKYYWRNTTVSENKDNIKKIITMMQTINPGLRIILTVSPIPLVCTFDYESAIIADCVSKSTLRSAVDEVIRELGNACYYWPSFEAFRWIGAYCGDAYGADDGCSCHASEKMLDYVFEVFEEKFAVKTDCGS